MPVSVTKTRTVTEVIVVYTDMWIKLPNACRRLAMLTALRLRRLWLLRRRGSVTRALRVGVR